MSGEQIRVERLTYADESGPRRGGWDVQYRDLSRDRLVLLFVPDAVVDAIRGSELDQTGSVRRLALRTHEHMRDAEDAIARARGVVWQLAASPAPVEQETPDA